MGIGTRTIALVLALGLMPLDLAIPPAARRPGQLSPSDGVVVETMSVEYAFAQQITFRLIVRSDAAITSAVVFFRTGSGQVQVGPADLSEVGAVTQAAFTLDLLGGVVPPFSAITYWWEIGDAAGRRSTTPSQTLDYVDNRLAWRSVADGAVHVHWYDGDSAFGQSALDVAREALPRLNQDLAAPLPPRVDVYVYGRAAELQSTLMLAGRPWQGGQARPDLGAVLIAVSPGPDDLLQLRRELSHELMHLLVYQAAGEGYANVPRWLDEGLAVLSEPSPNPMYQLILETAYRDNALISLETLCAPFPSDSQAALLSYAQSQSVVQFIRERYGRDSIRALIAAYRDGAGCAGGVERALGVTLGSLELAWRTHLGPQGAWQAVFNSIGAWVVLIVVLSLALLPLVFVKRKA